jgi:hypothetical protein
MFSKIKIAADRTRAIIDAFKGKFGADVEETIKAALPEGAIDFGDTPLEELLGSNPIHQFLQGLIDRIESAEGTLVTSLLYSFPDDGKELLLATYQNHGEETAKKQSGGSGNGPLDLNGIANFLNQVYLEGMPCDVVSSYAQNGDGSMRVDHNECLHRSKWENSGAPVEIMCELLDAWVEGCAKALNPGAKIDRESSIITGGEKCTCTISI